MQKWEYKALSLSRGYKHGFGSNAHAGSWEGDLDMQKMGEDGWELVSVVPISSFFENGDGFTSELYFYFKRPKP